MPVTQSKTQTNIYGIVYDIKIDVLNEGEVPVAYMTDLHISNDITQPYPSISVAVTDFAYVALREGMSDPQKKIKVNITNDKNHTPIIENFEYERQEIEGMSDEFVSVGLYGVHEKKKQLFSPIKDISFQYPRNKNDGRLVTEIIDKVATKVFGTYTKNFAPCTDKIRWIPLANMSAIDALNYLLIRASCKESGFYFMYYNLVTNKIEIFSSKKKFAGTAKEYNKVLLMTPGGMRLAKGKPESRLETSVIGYVNHDNGLGLVNSMAGAKRGFKEIKFKESDRTFKYEDKVTSFTDYYDDGQGETLIPNKSDLKPLQSEYNEFASPDSKYSLAREKFKHMEVVSFNVNGHLSRQVGDIIEIESEDNLKKRYQGTWFLWRLESHFSDKNFTQCCFCVRHKLNY